MSSTNQRTLTLRMVPLVQGEGPTLIYVPLMLAQLTTTHTEMKTQIRQTAVFMLQQTSFCPKNKCDASSPETLSRYNRDDIYIKQVLSHSLV